MMAAFVFWAGAWTPQARTTVLKADRHVRLTLQGDRAEIRVLTRTGTTAASPMEVLLRIEIRRPNQWGVVEEIGSLTQRFRTTIFEARAEAEWQMLLAIVRHTEDRRLGSEAPEEDEGDDGAD